MKQEQCKYIILAIMLSWLAFAIMCERMISNKNNIINNQTETIIQMSSKYFDKDAKILEEANRQYENVFGGSK